MSAGGRGARVKTIGVATLVLLALAAGAYAFTFGARRADGPREIVLIAKDMAFMTPGTPGALMTMLAEYGTLSLADVLEPAIEMADGYAIEAQAANSIERNKRRIKQWKYSSRIYLPPKLVWTRTR